MKTGVRRIRIIAGMELVKSSQFSDHTVEHMAAEETLIHSKRVLGMIFQIPILFGMLATELV